MRARESHLYRDVPRRHEGIDHTYSAWQSKSVTAADIIKEIKALPPDEQRRVLAEAIEEVSSHEPKETATLLQRAQRRLEHPEVPEDVWARTQLLYVCSPDNPTGRVTTADEWAFLFEMSDRYGFVIAADECYSEIYFDEAKRPVGALAVAHARGRAGFPRLVSFGSLSKRSNAPGLRSGYVAGDAELLKAFLLYRTYHGSAMSPAVAAASIAAWGDEAHVRANRVEYAAKFASLQPKVADVLPCAMPDAAFYLWAKTPIDDADFARRLLAEQAVTVLPGSFLARDAHGTNPGRGYVRIALVAARHECAEAIDRILTLARSL